MVILTTVHRGAKGYGEGVMWEGVKWGGCDVGV